MLLVSWFACRAIITRLAVPPHLAARIVMGAVALALLLTAEAALGILVFGRSPAEHLALYADTPALLGLAGQLLFAMFPALMLRLGAD